MEYVGSNLGVLFRARHHEAFDTRDALQVLHIPGHGFIVFRTNGGAKAAAAPEMAIDAFRADEMLDVLEHSSPFAQEFGGLLLAAERDQPFHLKFLIAAPDLTTVAGARPVARRAAIENDGAASFLQERESGGKARESRADDGDVATGW